MNQFINIFLLEINLFNILLKINLFNIKIDKERFEIYLTNNLNTVCSKDMETLNVEETRFQLKQYAE